MWAVGAVGVLEERTHVGGGCGARAVSACVVGAVRAVGAV